MGRYQASAGGNCAIPMVAPVIFQEGTYAPGLTDGIHRWMGSIAMDGWEIWLSVFSASNGANPSVFPSVFYTGPARWRSAGPDDTR